MKKVMFVFAGGGFLNESMPIYTALKDKFSIELAVSSDIDRDCLPQAIIDDKTPYSYICPVTLRSQSRLQNLGSLIKASFQALPVVFKSKADSVVCVGSSMALPLFLPAKIFNKKTVFIESFTRVGELSKTARILLKLRLVNCCYVQWPEQVEGHDSRVKYKGSLV